MDIAYCSDCESLVRVALTARAEKDHLSYDQAVACECKAYDATKASSIAGMYESWSLVDSDEVF